MSINKVDIYIDKRDCWLCLDINRKLFKSWKCTL